MIVLNAGLCSEKSVDFKILMINVTYVGLMIKDFENQELVTQRGACKLLGKVLLMILRKVFVVPCDT